MAVVQWLGDTTVGSERRMVAIKKFIRRQITQNLKESDRKHWAPSSEDKRNDPVGNHVAVQVPTGPILFLSALFISARVIPQQEGSDRWNTHKRTGDGAEQAALPRKMMSHPSQENRRKWDIVGECDNKGSKCGGQTWPNHDEEELQNSSARSSSSIHSRKLGRRKDFPGKAKAWLTGQRRERWRLSASFRKDSLLLLDSTPQGERKLTDIR